MKRLRLFTIANYWLVRRSLVTPELRAQAAPLKTFFDMTRTRKVSWWEIICLLFVRGEWACEGGWCVQVKMFRGKFFVTKCEETHA